MRMTMLKRAAILAIPGIAVVMPTMAGAAQPSRQVRVFQDSLRPVGNNPPAHGRATLVRTANSVQVVLVATGLDPSLPHAMHIHGDVEATNECPGAEVDTNGDNLVDTLEGLPSYGGILTTFTTSGGTSGGLGPDALDLSRAPVASRAGTVVFRRTFPIKDVVGPGEEGITRAAADNLGNLHIVIHGADLNHNRTYDFGPGTSTLSPLVGAPVPLEAELPVSCGQIRG